MIKVPVRSIVGAIDAAAARWQDRTFQPRIRARDGVAVRTGYSLAGVDYAFDRLFGELRRNAVESVIRDELGALDVLDGFAAREGRPKSRALPLGRICIVSSRTTIGVAVLPAIFALCAKCDVLVKDREDHLVGDFFSTLCVELPELAGFASAQAWSRENDDVKLSGYDAVVAFGDDETLATIASTLPATVRFIAYGSKASAGYITREALCSEAAARQIARDAALDLSLYEAEGCLSLHVLFAENRGTIAVERFVELLADAMRDIAADIPPARPNVRTSARRASARELATFRSNEAAYPKTAAGYLAILNPPFEEPPLFLPQTIAVRAVDDSTCAAEYFERHRITLEALAVTAARDDLLELAARCRVARVAPFGRLQAPPIGAFHGGRPRIAEFVRWIGDET
ncbi:MAG TPA: acyl-CoA reductase [Candidatus Cybelea sp.]|jgi:hypothetical protein|nr:acyl-CoA reductase [Candidatus Cybelea sp.]